MHRLYMNNVSSVLCAPERAALSRPAQVHAQEGQLLNINESWTSADSSASEKKRGRSGIGSEPAREQAGSAASTTAARSKALHNQSHRADREGRVVLALMHDIQQPASNGVGLRGFLPHPHNLLLVFAILLSTAPNVPCSLSLPSNG